MAAGVLAAIALSGCHGAKQGGLLAPRGPDGYTVARPTYTPPPANPLFISGYAGRRPAAPPGRARVVAPVEPAGEPSLLP